MHDRADTGQPETRDGVRVLRGVEIRSERHGLHGRADVVELHGGFPYPVEYKRGKPKSHHADAVQLCAQALCLEEMFDCDVSQGAIYYGRSRRRTKIQIDEELRSLTLATANAIRACRQSGVRPAAVYDTTRCDHCSLVEHCQPRLGTRRQNVIKWMAHTLEHDGVPE